MLHEVVGDAVEIERADYLQMLRFAGTWGAWSIIRTKHLERRSNPA